MARNKKRKVVTVMEEKKKGFIKKFVNEFKAFALKGNVMDLAVGVIIGAAFQDIVTSFTENFINPIIGCIGGADVEGKDMVIIDDMISSGDSMIEVATELKKRKAGRIFICATFGLFTDGMDKFDKAYEEGLFDYLLTTNLVYQTPELLQKPYYVNCDMSKYIAYIIDTLNHDTSISSLLSPLNRINKFLKEHNNQ